MLNCDSSAMCLDHGKGSHIPIHTHTYARKHARAQTHAHTYSAILCLVSSKTAVLHLPRQHLTGVVNKVTWPHDVSTSVKVDKDWNSVWIMVRRLWLIHKDWNPAYVYSPSMQCNTCRMTNYIIYSFTHSFTHSFIHIDHLYSVYNISLQAYKITWKTSYLMDCPYLTYDSSTIHIALSMHCNNS